jgi:hypothetical protein
MVLAGECLCESDEKKFNADIGATVSLQNIENQVIAPAVSAERN